MKLFAKCFTYLFLLNQCLIRTLQFPKIIHENNQSHNWIFNVNGFIHSILMYVQNWNNNAQYSLM